jgi:cell wall-associated NlpC family hydrolase
VTLAMCSIAVAAVSPAIASATQGTGGVAATAPATPTTAPVAPAKPKLVLAPITAKSSNLAYHGPVYVETATGAIVPFTTPAAAGQVNASAVSTAGGITMGAPVTEAKPELLVPGIRARYINGLAAAPMGAPAAIQQMIWAANQIIGLPYIYGGGHQSFISPGYDCSGTVSFALHGAKLLTVPEDSSEFESFGSHGAGRWVAIFANPGHAYVTIAGLRLDTSSADDPSNQQGPRWRPLRPANEGFVVRHPLGL